MEVATPCSDDHTVSEWSLFEEMESARLLSRWQCSGSDEERSPESSECSWDGVDVGHGGLGIFSTHVCDCDCPFLEIMPGGEMSCSLTGATNRITTSGQATYNAPRGKEDGTSGVPVGGWRKKRDAFRASQLAYIASEGCAECDPNTVEEQKEKRRKTVECVQVSRADAPVLEDHGTEQLDVSLSSRQEETLKFEATKIFTQMTKGAQDQPACSTKWKSGAPTRTSESCSDKVKQALKKYLREVASKNQVPSLNTMHDICLSTQEFRMDTPDATASRDIFRCHPLENVLFREAFSRLVVCMWTCVTQTPHYKTSNKKKNSFRSFVCGMAYAFKRGLVLSCGSVIVPQSDIVASALENSKSSSCRSTRKMHSFSHKGLACIHRCVSSVKMDGDRFSCVHRASQHLSNFL